MDEDDSGTLVVDEIVKAVDPKKGNKKVIKFLESCGGKRAMIEGWHTRTEVRRERAHAQGACMPARSDMCACMCAASARARQCVHALPTLQGARTA